jgi:hypothetical protein
VVVIDQGFPAIHKNLEKTPGTHEHAQLLGSSVGLVA